MTQKSKQVGSFREAVQDIPEGATVGFGGFAMPGVPFNLIKALLEHGGDPSQIEAIAMDMSPAYVKGATEHFPRARIVFDKFHVMMLAGKALDEVRRELHREGADLKGAMWSLRGNSWNLSEDRQEQRKISVVSTPNLAVR